MPTPGNAGEINREIEAWLKKVEKSVSDYSKRDRRKILTRAARPVVKSARRLAPESDKPHYRKEGTKSIKYNPGNLRRSIKRLTLKKSQDAFIGPQFRKEKVAEYGGPGQPTDAYYAAMIYGSAAAFNRRVLAPALSQSAPAIRNEVSAASLAAIKSRARNRGIKTN
jgi:hypothetical protein